MQARGPTRTALLGLTGLGVLAAVASFPACGGHSVVYLSDAPDGSARDAAGAQQAKPSGTARVENGGELTAFTHSYAFVVTTTVGVALLLFLSDRPRTCAEHLAGIDYVGQQDIHFSLYWTKENGPRAGRAVTGAWHFTGSKPLEPPMPKVEAWFLEHRTCGEPATVWGSPSWVNEDNVLTLTEASPERITGSFITEMGFSTAGWTGPRGYYLSGSFDTVPCLVEGFETLDATVARVTLPSTTCR